MLVSHQISTVDGGWIRPLMARGDGMQVGAFVSPHGIHFTVKGPASEWSSAHAKTISRAYVEFVETVLDPITMQTGQETPVIATLINADSITVQYRKMFDQHVAKLQKGVVNPDLEIDSKGTLTFRVYSNGQPDSIEPILTQIADLVTTDLVDSVSAFGVQTRGFFLPPSDDYVHEVSTRGCECALESILAVHKKANIPIRGVVVTPNGKRIIHVEDQDPRRTQFEALDAKPLKEYMEAPLKALPLLTSDPFLKGFKKALEHVDVPLKFLSVVQLIEWIAFRVLEKELQGGNEFSSIAHCLVFQQETAGPIQLKGHTAEPKELERSLRVYGQFMRLLRRGGVLRTIDHILTSYHRILNDPLAQREVQQRGRNAIPLSRIKQIHTYFMNCLNRYGHPAGYRVTPEALSQFNQPILELIKSQCMVGIPLSSVLIEWTLMLQQLLGLLQGIEKAQETAFLNEVQPSLETLIHKAALKSKWSQKKVEKAKNLILFLTNDLLLSHERFCRGKSGLANSILPTLRLIPLEKFARLHREAREEDVYLWLKRNRNDLVDLRDYLQVLLDLSNDYHRSLRSALNHLSLPVIYCLNTDMEDYEFKEINPAEGLQESASCLKSSSETSQLDLTQIDVDESTQAVIESLRSVHSSSLADHYLLESGKNLLDKLFELIEQGSAQHQQRLRVSEELQASESSKARGKSRGKRQAGRGKDKPAKKILSKKQIEPKSAVEAPVAPPLSLQPLVAEDPLAVLYDTMSQAMENYGSRLTNLYACQSWQNAIEIYKDLFAEFVDLPDYSRPTHVSDYVNRLVVLLSLLMEQVVSAHALDSSKPTDLLGRHETIDHDCLKMLPASGLENRIPDIQERLKSINGIEILSRNLLTHRRKKSRAAQLLYEAHRLSSESSSETDRAASIVSATHDLLRDQLQLLGDVLETPLDLTATRTLKGCLDIPVEQERADIANILKKIGGIQKRFTQFLQRKISCSSHQQAPQEYLRDASRLLSLIQARIERRSEVGNMRNFFKELATFMALSLEFSVVTLAGFTGQLDHSRLKWTRSSHDLTNWFERLGFYDLKPEEEEFLEACDRIHNLTRYSANYGTLQNQSQDFYLQLLKRMKRSDAMCQAGIGEATWQSTDRRLRSAVQAALVDSYERLSVGLALLSKVLDKLERTGNSASSFS